MLLLVVLMLAACLTQFATDIYAPSLPAISVSLGTSVDYVQWSMATYMLGVALSQLIYGPISEGVGRKPPMIIGLFVMFIGSVICLISGSVESLIIGRFVQGCGAGACASLWRSVFRDTYTGEELAKYSSYLVVFIMFIVPAAPLLGGYLQEFFSWRASFVFMVVYTLVALLGIILGFTETNKTHSISKLSFEYIISRYLMLFKSRIFMTVTCSTFLSYGANFIWFVVGPVLLIEKIGISPVDFGWLTFCGGGGAYALAGYLNGKFVKRMGMAFMMRFGWSIMIIASVLMLIAHATMGLNIYAIMLPIILFYFGSTFIWPNAFATAFTPFGSIAGYAGALYGFMQICGAAVLAGVVSYLPDSDQFIMAVMMLVSSICAWLVYEFGKSGDQSN